MKVEQIMTSNIACLDCSNTVYDAAITMQKHNIGFVPVCDSEKLVGVLTDRDMVTRCIAQGADPKSTSVTDIMTEDIQRVSPEENISTVEDIMCEHKIRRLPVTEDDRIVGVVSIGDMATCDGQHTKAKRALTDISSPSEPANI